MELRSDLGKAFAEYGGPYGFFGCRLGWTLEGTDGGTCSGDQFEGNEGDVVTGLLDSGESVSFGPGCSGCGYCGNYAGYIRLCVATGLILFFFVAGDHRGKNGH